MKDLSHPWSVYADLQASLRNASRVTSRTWGLESALNEILDAQLRCSTATPQQIAKASSTAARRERAHSLLRRKHQHELSPKPVDVDRMLEARSALAQIKAAIESSDLSLLVSVADQVGERGKTPTSGAIRVKVCRLRKKLRMLLRAASVAGWGAMKLARSGRSLFARERRAPLIERCRAKPNGDMPSGAAPLRFAPTGERVWVAPCCPAGLCRVRFVPPQGSRQNAPARLRRLSLGLALVSPARHRLGRRFSYRG